MHGFILKIGIFYLLLGLGMYLRRYYSAAVQKKIGAFLVGYALPFIFFASALSIKDLALITVAGLSFLLSMLIFGLVIAVKAGGDDSVALGTMSAWANNAFIGMPLAAILFGARGLEIATLWATGSITFFAIVSSLMTGATPATSRGKHMFLRKIFLPPYIPAFLFGYFLNRHELVPAGYVFDVLSFLKVIIFALSIMYVGACLQLKREVIQFRLIRSALFFKHLISPLLLFVILAIDSSVSGIFSAADHHALFLMAIMPIAINAVVLFQERAHLQAQAALCVTVSTFITAALASIFLYIQLPIA